MLERYNEEEKRREKEKRAALLERIARIKEKKLKSDDEHYIMDLEEGFEAFQEAEEMPEKCPVCGKPMQEVTEENLTWAAEHVVGVAKGAREDIIEDLRANFNGECCEVGMYLAMARVAHREGYPEIGLYWEKAAYEEAEHAAKFAELLGEVVTDSTAKNLKMRIEAENGATMGKTNLAKRAKELGLDAIHDTVHEMARDEARHGRAFEGLYNRYFKK